MINYMWKIPEMDDLVELYESVGWRAYTQNLPALEHATKHSTAVLSAYDGNQLVGLARVLTDETTILYLQDILVHPKLQRQGIGKNLIHKVCLQCETIRQKVLITDDTEKTKQFYESVGFNQLSHFGFIGFYHD